MDHNDADGVALWDGEVRIEEAVWATRRDGSLLQRDGEPYKAGTVRAFDRDSRALAAWLTFEVYESIRMVLLGNANADGTQNVGGADRRGKGAGRAMMDALERRYPAPEWWFAADLASHSTQGLRLMRSRRKPGRMWVHTSSCEERNPQNCSCEFPEPVASREVV